MPNELVRLKLEILKWVEIEIRLDLDPLKFSLSSNGLSSNGLKKCIKFIAVQFNPININNFKIVIFNFYNHNTNISSTFFYIYKK